MRIADSRPEFRLWIDRQPEPQWQLLPLTHITKALVAGDIIREEKISTRHDEALDAAVAFFFYGRAAYRVHGDGPVRSPSSCPFLFVLDSSSIHKAHNIHAFDTGAFTKRLFKHALMDEMTLPDFSLGTDPSRPNKLIATTFGSLEKYANHDTSAIEQSRINAPASEMLANSYIDLLASKGRNEPDDRVGTIEVTISDTVILNDALIAVIVPDIFWHEGHRAPWLQKLVESGVSVRPFKFFPGKLPDYYLALIDIELRKLYEEMAIL